MADVLVLGGYGNFGKRICRALVAKGIGVIIAGRCESKANSLKNEIGSNLASIAVFDANKDLDLWLKKLKPKVAINTCGPFQMADYGVAEICAANNTHYIDLADGRGFVCGISALDEMARKANIAIISGASTVPTLSSAVLEAFKGEFSSIESMRFGIAPGQKAERGLATTIGILSYVGKPLLPYAGHKNPYGWQDAYVQKLPMIGNRYMANCDIPDLDLLPQKYDIKSIQFSAGLELGILHFGLWWFSYLVRGLGAIGINIDLSRYGEFFYNAAKWFDRFGSDDGGMFIIISGKDQNGAKLVKKWYIIAKNGDGPQIPTIPAIILAHKLVKDDLAFKGASACVGMLGLDEYLAELDEFEIEIFQD